MTSRRMPTIPPLVITDEERAELQRRVRAHTSPQRAAKRARIVLLAADGLPNRQIGPIVGLCPTRTLRAARLTTSTTRPDQHEECNQHLEDGGAPTEPGSTERICGMTR
jgi:hypothetical protein